MDETLTRVCFQPHHHASEWYQEGHEIPTVMLMESMSQEMAWRVAERYSRWVIRTEPKDELEETFHSLAKQWRKETAHLSFITERAMHVAYQRIIGMGPEAVPLLLRELEARPDHWLWALNAITGEDPARPEDNFRSAVEAWIKWGKEQGHI